MSSEDCVRARFRAPAAMLLKPGIKKFTKFVVVGIANTAINAVALWALREIFIGTGVVENPNPPASVIAFLIANVFSYYANSRWSFRSHTSRAQYLRFLATSLIGAAMAYGIMVFGDRSGWHYMVSFLVMSGALVPVNFILMQIFVFSEKNSASA